MAKPSLASLDAQIAGAILVKGWMSASDIERALRAIAIDRRDGACDTHFADWALEKGFIDAGQAKAMVQGFDLDADQEPPLGSEGMLAQMQLCCPGCETMFSPPEDAYSTGRATCPSCGRAVDLERLLSSSNEFRTNNISALGMTTADGPDAFLGKVIGGCRVKRKLGQGGMGAVYLAEHVNLQKERALKILPPGIARDQTYAERFIQEARLCAKLEHRNIVQVYDVGQHEHFFYLVMQFVNGGAVSRLLKKKGRLKISLALTLAEQVAAGLACAHDAGIVHRDVKPDNILLTTDGTVKVGDFGLAKTRGMGADLTTAGLIMGSPAYMSPEQCDGRAVDHRSDLYSLGVTLYQLLTGQRPFVGPTPLAVMLMHQTESPPPPSELEPSVPPPLDDAILRLLEKRPDDRYPDARTVAKRLRALRKGIHEGKGVRVATRPQRPRGQEDLFGMIAISSGLLTREQVGEALQLQKRRRPTQGRSTAAVGSICVEEGFIDDVALETILSLQKRTIDRRASQGAVADGGDLESLDIDDLLAPDDSLVGFESEDALQRLAPADEAKGRRALERLKTKAYSAYTDGSEPRNALGLFKDFLRQYRRTSLEVEAHDFLNELTPKVSAKYDKKGLEAAQQTKFDVAISHFNTALELNPNYPMAYNNRGIVHMRRGEFDQALVNFNEAIERNASEASFYYNRGNVYRKLGKLDEALDDYDRAIELVPEHDKALCNRGGVKLTRKQFDEALVDFELALRANPRNEEALNGRGRIYIKLDQPEKAIDEFTRLVGFMPKSAKAYNSLGEAFMMVNWRTDAKRNFNRARKLDGQFPDPLYNLAVLAALDSKAGEAITLLKQALKQGYSKYRRIRREPAFAPLNDDSEYRSLLAGMR